MMPKVWPALVAVLVLLALALTPRSSGATAGGAVNFAPPNLPEGLAVDSAGVTYVGFASTGEIRRIAPDGGVTTLARLRTGIGGLLGLAVDGQGNVLAALNSKNTPGSDRHGVWRIAPDGAKQLAAELPASTFPNAIALGPGGLILVSDSIGGAIWRIRPGGADRWLQSDLLRGDLQLCPPPVLSGPIGANGLVFAQDGSLLVANTTKAQIVRVPVNPDGSAGTPSLAHGPDCATLLGADGLAVDAGGALIVTLNLQNRLIRIEPGGAIQTLATADDGLDFPASVAATAGGFVVTNYALLAFLNNASPRPSLLTIDRR